MNLDAPIEQLKSVGPKNLARLHRLGIKTIRHLLWHLPARYEDYSVVTPVEHIEVGQRVTVQGEVVKISSRRIFPRRMTVVNAIIQDDSGTVRAVWFNQPYIENTLAEGSRVSLAGKASLDAKGVYLSSPTYEKIQETYTGKLTHTGRLVPVYPETEGITSKYLRFLIQPLTTTLRVYDPLPDDIRQDLNLPSLTEALKNVHFPAQIKEADQAKERLAFDELLLFQLKALLERRKYNQLKSVPVLFDQAYIKSILTQLPFELTRDQKVAAWEIFKDLEKSYPMNRLLEGDVGSGKTVVAMLAAAQLAQKKLQSALLAPTEVLASQHFDTISRFVEHLPLNVGVLTSTTAQINGESLSKPLFKRRVAAGQVDIIIGTHALLQKDVRFKQLGLVIIDEQHRFGIEQRAALAKGSASGHGLVPHLLSMTATPIPRTLALTIFGDLDISIIKEKPKNRKKIITRLVTPAKRKEAYEFIREQVGQGRQVFVICPRIENPSEPQVKKGANAQMKMVWAEVKAVQEEYERLRQHVFPDLRIAMLHGKMKSKEKQQIMHEFKEGWHNILVATSVIEVGVDVPNASLMVIEGAERFGLAQLHQFRGRVGRAEYQSYCFLLPTNAEAHNNQRLKALVTSDDGFLLAEKDMSLRGPGEFFGIKQSGMPDLAMAALADVELIKKARFQARSILKIDPRLERYPLLKQQLEQF
ncbi:MAG: ATP-dependent DNA helicase RecG, partial [Candidatus Yanofskybacteria bacterium]|nr:ATP-dependent DNA helicase RecG [Candidatus Yanofskybacteria bacterium]